MYEPLRLTIRTPEGTLADASGIRWVHVPLSDGGTISIWPGHAPLLAETQRGIVRYADSDGEHSVPIAPGVLVIASGTVSVMSGGATDQMEEAPIARLEGELMSRISTWNAGRRAEDDQAIEA